MTLHQFDKKMLPDEAFIPGELAFLVEGNQCRLLDGRRTTGFIEKYFHESGMFRWRITNFEDQGKYWDVPAEKVVGYQFEKDSKRLDSKEVETIEGLVKKFSKDIIIETNSTDKEATEREIEIAKKQVQIWMKEHSLFIKSGGKLDLTSNIGPELLHQDLRNYMDSVGMLQEEKNTSELMVLNPNSGEWIKGLNIVLAEMGLVSYRGKISRTKDIFEGIGDKANRCNYIIHRLAFLRGFFAFENMKEVTLYRGMTCNNDWKSIDRSLLPCSFSLEVGMAFGNFDRENKYKIAYLIKMTVPVEKLFMTYLETEAMNRQYKEAEAVIFHDEKIVI